MQIRIAECNDMEAILKYDSHIPAERLQHCIKEQWVWVLCVPNGQIVGILRYSLFWQVIPFLDLIYIDAAFRGKNWGTEMMCRWERMMQNKGYSHTMLSTQEDETAKSFYEKLGYQRIGAFLPPEQDSEEIMYLKEF